MTSISDFLTAVAKATCSFSDFANFFSIGDGEGEGRLVSKVCGSIAIRDVQMR